jgi:uncharacterized protein YqeY
MGLQAELDAALREALKTGQSERVSVIRLVLAAVKNRQIDKGKSRPLTEGELLEVVVAASKQRREAIELYKQGGRQDLVDKETRELKILSDFLPAQVTPEELDAKITEALKETGASGPKDLGKLMKWLMPQLAGRVDGAQLSERVKARLNQLTTA